MEQVSSEILNIVSAPPEDARRASGMRFARHARIFRGPLDPAPVAAVVLLLLIFMLLGSLLYTPGVLVEIGQPITVKTNNDIVFDGKTYPSRQIEDQLRSALQALPGDGPFSVNVEPGADPKVAQQVSNLFRNHAPRRRISRRDGQRDGGGGGQFSRAMLFGEPAVQEAELNVELSAPPANAPPASRAN